MPKNKAATEFYSVAANFFVRANDLQASFREHGWNHLDGFHFSQALPLADGFSDLEH